MSDADATSQSRLQRPPDFTGGRLNRFDQVFWRHGFPVALVSALVLMWPEMRSLLAAALTSVAERPDFHVAVGVVTLVLMFAYLWLIDRRLDAAAVRWVLYLCALSVWEEWMFRVVLPHAGEASFGFMPTVLASNLLFGAMHYFTLRWKWHWCLAAFFGGLALSRQLETDATFAAIVWFHWIGTFINTPRPPGRGRDGEASSSEGN